MVRFFISIFSALSLAACSLGHSIERAALFVIDCVAVPFRTLFVLDAGTPAFAGSGSPLDPSLIQGLRHEAHVRRRSADRNV